MIGQTITVVVERSHLPAWIWPVVWAPVYLVGILMFVEYRRTMREYKRVFGQSYRQRHKKVKP